MKNLPNILAFVGFAILSSIAFLTPKPPLESPEIVEVIPNKQENAYPVKITIKSIGITAPIESVGVLEGAMAVPTFGHNVGWYSFGTRPGDVGSAVLAGHVNWMNGEDAVFTNLKDIKVGDVINVTNNYGKIDNFIVREIKSYPVWTDTTEIFSSSDGLSHLNLITCNGDWNDWLNTHDSRLVVFTDKIHQN